MGDSQSRENATVLGFKNNDREVFRSVYARVFPKVRGYILKNSGDEDQAKDVFQDAFIACWQNIKEGRFPGGNVEAYLFAIAKNKWIDHLRSPRFKTTTTTPTAYPLRATLDAESGTDPEEEEQLTAIRSGLSKLGDNCKTLLRLFYYERKSMEEIAGKLGLAPASARNQKYRCMERLRALSHKILRNGN